MMLSIKLCQVLNNLLAKKFKFQHINQKLTSNLEQIVPRKINKGLFAPNFKWKSGTPFQPKVHQFFRSAMVPFQNLVIDESLALYGKEDIHSRNS
ncbi:unnamed protein product [Macrosiphum euphorbiae]|uniref:Uncharacterized protein n=1 Tax=Macrosiphum euphorbiae TaxID=13131 RepID=A0AAV0WSZ6_9HEMI|nr:unnamed protein product [Macrosiphum euphorbiae]